MKGIQSKDMQRSSEDGAIIEATFILNVKQTYLYKKSRESSEIN